MYFFLIASSIQVNSIYLISFIRCLLIVSLWCFLVNFFYACMFWHLLFMNLKKKIIHVVKLKLKLPRILYKKLNTFDFIWFTTFDFLWLFIIKGYPFYVFLILFLFSFSYHYRKNMAHAAFETTITLSLKCRFISF